jgi:hypothetical protein
LWTSLVSSRKVRITNFPRRMHTVGRGRAEGAREREGERRNSPARSQRPGDAYRYERTIHGVFIGTDILNFATQRNPCAGLFNWSIAIEQSGSRLRGACAGDACGMGVAASFIVDRR